MVVFTCNHCGESLQKPKVEKHYQFVCRTVKSLTCVDCFKDFKAEEYVVHTKCITEEERYSAKGTYQNGIVKKGEAKQESWVEMVRSILNNQKNMKPSHRNLLNLISNNTNIPRKRAKFINFIKSSTGGRTNIKDIEEVWDIIENYKNEQQKLNNKNNATEENIKNETNEATKRKITEETQESEEVPQKKKKKEKPVEVIKQDTTEETPEKFNFKEKILEIVNAKGTISLKKLQKKVLKAYLKSTGESECDPNVIKKFNKKLKKVNTIVISDDKVSLTETK